LSRIVENNTNSPSGAEASVPGEQVDFAEVWRPDELTSARGPEKILLDLGYISPEQCEEARLQQQKTPQQSVLEILTQAKAIDPILALQAVAAYCHLPFMRVEATNVDESAFALLPAEYLKAKLVLPIGRQDNAVLVGISDPADIFLIDDIKRRVRGRVQLVVVPGGDILRTIEEILAADSQQRVDDIIKDIAEDEVEVVTAEEDDVITDLEKIAGESPVIRYVNFVISTAVRDGASDIHVEPGERRLRVRYRIDGALFEQQAPPLKMHAAIISRLKIMANMDIAERRLPQDGRIRASVHGRAIDLRVSTLPVTNGEKCVLRILDNRSITVGLEKLGMADETLAAFRRHIHQPHGIVLVTGPTGSGKSTTLYSGLQVMDRDKLNISTVEDPVEYELANINQVNVHDSIGMTFAAALRSLLRQDPDVVLLGEIRDEETARIAVQASLTGHLVLSTLHTNDAPSSITRMINIGIEPFLISAAVNAVLAQRLVRRICENCKTPVTTLKDNVAAYLEKYGVDTSNLCQGAGCEKCRHTGYKGRLGIYEIMEMDDEIRDIITSNPTLNELRAATHEHGMVDLRSDGLRKIAAGLTTAEEIMQVTET
jgi:type IV pilus assembly protein PilB